MYESYTLIDGPVVCPYNESHRIARSRIQRHIVKCEKNYPDDYKVLCPFNATHRLFKHEMKEHIITCPMRQLIEPELYQRTGNHVLMKNKLYSDVSSSIDCNECWEDELDLESNWIPNMENNYESKVTKTDYMNLRPPRGFAEALLVEVDRETNEEDMESMTSSMGLGRGKTMSNGNLTRTTQLGRGKPLKSKYM